MASLLKDCHANVFCGIEQWQTTAGSTCWSGSGESGDDVGESTVLNYWVGSFCRCRDHYQEGSAPLT